MPRLRFEPRRELGRTGFRATAIGVGDVADRAVPFDVCVATVRRALDFGLNLVDTAPAYADGYSEEIVGEALRGRARDAVFVIDKIDHLDEPVAPQVDASLARLRIAHADLFVFHAVSTLDDWRHLSAPGGGFDELRACVEAKRTRFRGISSHHPDVLARAVVSGLCDVVMFPVGPKVDARYVREILPLAKARGVGTVCFKTFGAGKLLGDTVGYNEPLPSRSNVDVRSLDAAGAVANAHAPTLPHMTVGECVRYTLTRDPDVALLGMSDASEQDAALAAAEAFVPMTDAEAARAERRGAEAALGKGVCHWDPPDALPPVC